ncbi:MAG: S8 family serine peptidase [bacterium]|jgi:hypothetical protein|nr:S8 family serine peptidase [bacterium]
MRKLILCSVLAALGTGLLASDAHALRNLALKQQGELPRDLYVDLIDPDHVYLDKLVVKFVEDTRIRLRDERLVSLEGWGLSGLDSFLKANPSITVERLFESMGEEELDSYVAEGERLSGWDVADLNNWYLFRIEGRNADAQALLLDLLKLDLVQTGYYEPIASPAVCGSDPAPVTPNWAANQDYREAAPTGIDIDYAWAHDPTYGNGVSSYWFQDLEWGWCEDHEDFASTFTIRNTPDSTDPDFFNHGTAVVSIVGACDDGKGVTGLVPDCRMTARVVSNHASTAAALIAIGSDLITGETYLIEMHAQGPDQGTTCVCNCTQFRYIAMEYWQANFDAILANSTNGRFCVEAAGNGSMDLDWAGYAGAFNLNVRDSQAIIVGAGTSGAVHNPTCWTNHGTRISAMGWGENVYAAGYGGLFNQTGCQQDYTSTFSGTSSASPIVTGAAISLALIHNAQEGSYPSPLTLRSRLQTNGTPQGPTDTWKEINVLPNMKGILAPDLEPYAPGGWAAPIVPSNVTGTTVLPASLPPAPADTYFDFAWVNWSRYGSVPNSWSYIYRDDVLFFTALAANHAPFTYRHATDWAGAVRGGLHYMRQTCDPNGIVDESVETNNGYVVGYRWAPTAIANNVPQTFTRGPNRSPQGYSTFALDGYSNGGNFTGWWDVFAVMPANASDYDIYMYNTNPTPTTGWNSTVAVSAGVSTVDFVGCNNNSTSDGDYVGIINYSNSDESYTIEGEGSTYISVPPAVPTLASSGAIAAGEIIDVLEMQITALDPVHFVLDITSGNADLALFIFGPTSTYFARSGAQWTLNGAGNGGDEAGTFTPTATGFHGIVICKNLRTQVGESAGYSLYWGPPAGDLTHTTLAGWTAPVVARNAGSVGVLPAVLNEGTTYADAGLINIGAGTMASGSNLAFYLDGPFVYSSGNFSALAPGWTGSISNRDIGTVKGGRHELGSVIDYLSEVAEELPNGETNNAHFAQYAWAPYALAQLTPLSRTPAPNWINSNNPNAWSNPGFNQDGYQLSTTYWTGVAAMPTIGSEQLNVWAYDDADNGSSSAFIATVESNFPAPGEISFIMANGNVLGNYVTRNVGVTNNWGYPGVIPSTNYTVQMSQRIADLLVGTATAGTLNAGAGGGQILHTYDINLVAGETYPINLRNFSTVNLGVALFEAGQSFTSLDNATAVFNSGGSGQNEAGTFTASVSGWHGVAVYRSASTDLGPAASYNLSIGSRKPATPLIVSIVPVDFTGGNAIVHVEITPVNQDINGNPIVVDYYNLYYDDNGYMTSPGVEATTGTSLDLYYHNVGMTQQGYLRVTAVDVDGVVVADTNPDQPLPDARTTPRAPAGFLQVAQGR